MAEYIQSEDIVMRKIGEAFFLIDIHQNYSADNMFLHINSTGSYIWQQLAAEISVESIGEKILTEMADQAIPDADEIINDISEFIELLVKSGYARETEHG